MAKLLRAAPQRRLIPLDALATIAAGFATATEAQRFLVGRQAPMPGEFAAVFLASAAKAGAVDVVVWPSTIAAVAHRARGLVQWCDVVRLHANNVLHASAATEGTCPSPMAVSLSIL